MSLTTKGAIALSTVTLYLAITFSSWWLLLLILTAAEIEKK